MEPVDQRYAELEAAARDLLAHPQSARAALRVRQALADVTGRTLAEEMQALITTPRT